MRSMSKHLTGSVYFYKILTWSQQQSIIVIKTCAAFGVKKKVHYTFKLKDG